ncbi:hypothetical protein QQF64_001769 [Cirrhinus molitorella]|uniref:Uncharacterized protein n=1 Tax=Cirrhinus molitorella TaxID=172907 RepID=A0ABR3MNB0_9TELE
MALGSHSIEFSGAQMTLNEGRRCQSFTAHLQTETSRRKQKSNRKCLRPEGIMLQQNTSNRDVREISCQRGAGAVFIELQRSTLQKMLF